jgi:hypothetical protein
MVRYGTVISLSVFKLLQGTYVKGHKNSVDKINFKIFFTSFIISQSGIINLQQVPVNKSVF